MYQDSSGKVLSTQTVVNGTSYDADWYLPVGTATGFMLVEHGFSRNCGNLRNVSLNFLQRGIMVLCLNTDMTGGKQDLGIALGEQIANGQLQAPEGRSMPAAIVVGGHSAGGHFATAVGRRLAERNVAGFRGAVLFDPVAAGGFTDNLMAISAGGTRGVFAITSNGSLCNQFNNAYGALKQISNPFVGVQLTSKSTHVDSEGYNTNFLGYVACLQSPPKGNNIQILQDMSGVWAADLLNGTHNPDHYPGGNYFTLHQSWGELKPIK
ncbi:MAG: hypothetical protein REI12_11840 [Pedobacter sp.]|nr:hypothetical protein [Pedobacter sp.]